MDSFDAIVRLLRQITPMDVPQAIDQATPLFAAIVSPMYQQIDPHELGQMGRYLAEIEEYAVRVMKRWSYRNEKEDQIRRIVRDLVWEFPSHGFVIDFDEAEKLGLKVELMDFSCQELSNQILDRPDSLIGWGFPEMEIELDEQNQGNLDPENNEESE